MFTEITYKQASDLLGVDVTRIRNAVSRGNLTQVPGKRYQKSVYREQVILFQGKPVTLDALSTEDREIWDSVDRVSRKSVYTVPFDSQKIDEVQRETEKELLLRAVRIGQDFRKGFLAGVLNKLPSDLAE